MTVFYFPLMTLGGWSAFPIGEPPLWTPQIFGGYPIFADGEIGLAYPPVLLALLVLPADRAFVVLRLLHLSIAALDTLRARTRLETAVPSAVLVRRRLHHSAIFCRPRSTAKTSCAR